MDVRIATPVRAQASQAQPTGFDLTGFDMAIKIPPWEAKYIPKNSISNRSESMFTSMHAGLKAVQWVNSIDRFESTEVRLAQG